jgi:molybdate/tungstate transport system substrate-binding protein
MRWLVRLLGAFAIVLGPMAARAAGTVDVLYAGSLVNIMEHAIGPAFGRASGDTFQGFAGGSQGLANQIKGKLRRADVFVSASPRVNESLMGNANGGWVSWYVLFGESPVVIGYNPNSRFAAELKSKPWYEVLAEPGIRLGRTDPKLDPKGALTVALLKRAEQTYHQPGLAEKVLGADENPAQVLPEETLVGRLQSGELDVGFFYSTETTDAHILSVELPADIRPQAQYTVTVVNNAANPAGAAQFIAFLLGPDGSALLKQHGMNVIAPKLNGTAQDVPEAVRTLLPTAK